MPCTAYEFQVRCACTGLTSDWSNIERIPAIETSESSLLMCFTSLSLQRTWKCFINGCSFFCLFSVLWTVALKSIQGIVWHFGQCAFSLSCWGSDKKWVFDVVMGRYCYIWTEPQLFPPVKTSLWLSQLAWLVQTWQRYLCTEAITSSWHKCIVTFLTL